MGESQHNGSQPRRQLSLFDSICIIVGIIIGAGIFESSPIIAANTTGVADQVLSWGFFGESPDESSVNRARTIVLISAWLIGGLVTLCGALCYAELSTAYAQEGGDYNYLRLAYGKWLGYLFCWAAFWIIRPANIGAMAFVFAKYGSDITPFEESTAVQVVYACVSVVILCGFNLVGLRGGPLTQNVLTVAKLLGLATVIVAAFVLPIRESQEISGSLPTNPSIGLAAVFIVFSLGGWNDLVLVAGEVKNPKRNLVRALVLGMLAVITIYVLSNLAFVAGLGYERAAASREVATDLMRERTGIWGARLVSAVICVSALGAINGMVFTGGRIYYTLGQDHRSFRWLGAWSDRWGGPVRAIIVQVAFTLVLIVTFGQTGQGFEQLVISATPVFWTFFFFVGMGLFVLRDRDPDTPRPFRVTGYPIVPLIFCLSSLGVLYSSVSYAIANLTLITWSWPVGIMLIGALLFAPRMSRR